MTQAKRLVRSGIILIVAVGMLISPVLHAHPTVAQTGTTHTVQAGENLFRIALRYGVTVEYLASVNGIADQTQIYAGQQLIIPGASAPGTAAVAPPVAETAAQPAPAATAFQGTHVVQAGEHLSAIASMYGVSWPAIAAVNGLSDPNQIYAGQTLIIPTADTGQGVYIQPDAWTPPAAPAPTISTGKQIVVDLSDQRTYAYENGALVRNTLVSTGLWGTPTVTGDYQIYVKYDAQLMTGPGYYLPGVPWVMYFYQGYSLHGTYWHNNFGQPMSHGCVNMPTSEAAWFYTWAPIGTPVHVQQ